MFRRLLCFVLGCMVVVSCSQEPTVTVINMPTSPTDYAQVAPSPMPSSTTLPATVPSLTATSILPEVATILAPFDQSERIMKLLEEPVCDFPCLWNITPGSTTWDNANNLFVSLGLSSEDKRIGVYTMHKFVIYSSEQIYETSIEAYDRNGVVEYLAMKSTLPEDDFRKLYANYEPKKILEKYGIPDRVFVFATLLGKTSYDLDLYYDIQGFYISIGGRVQSYNETSIVICPDFSKGNFSGMGIYTQSQDIKQPIENSPIEGLREHFFLMKSYRRTIEEAAGLTKEEFKDQFVGDNPSYCFTISD